MAQLFNLFNMDFSEVFFRVKLVSGIISALFFICAFFFIAKFQKLIKLKVGEAQSSSRFIPAATGGLLSKWEEIMRHAESSKEAEWKFAIIEADNLVDSILKSSGYTGDTMGERLMNINREHLVTLEGLWEAHKIRNRLAHDSNYFLRYAEARKTIQLYKNTLEELNAL